jgi:hypothetical protein
MDYKTRWSQPKLIILGRGTPEESVLCVCKSWSSYGPKGSGCQKERCTDCFLHRRS